jgi:hypothetical protein
MPSFRRSTSGSAASAAGRFWSRYAVLPRCPKIGLRDRKTCANNPEAAGYATASLMSPAVYGRIEVAVDEIAELASPAKLTLRRGHRHFRF